MSTPRILLLGGHGKVSLLMTPKFLARSWNLTSMIRNPEQKAAILEAGKKGPGEIDVLVESLEDVKNVGDAKRILDQVMPDWVVWSAGAGGKGGPERTNAIDREACIHFIKASIANPRISKFLLVSALSSRRERAPWWDDDSYALVQKMNKEVLPAYYKAKLAADEALTVLGEERVMKDGLSKFSYIVLRPGGLSDQPATSKVSLGKTKARGMVPREDVADIAARLLEKDGVKGWIDLLGGEEDSQSAVDRIISEKIDAVEGESLGIMKSSM